MKIQTKYNIDDKIYIIPCKIWGKIIGFSYYTRLKYDVRYFDTYLNVKECLFLEEEISLQSDEPIVGFTSEKKD